MLAWRRGLLAEGGRAVDLDWLLDLAGGLSWPVLQRLRLEADGPVSLACPPARLERLWREHRRSHTPLQYLVGVCPWRDLELGVSPAVLIPRQETELLPELAVTAAGQLPADRRRRLLWADLGTGSGCLAVALSLAFPEGLGVAVDCSPEALALARLNLAQAGTEGRVDLWQGSWWNPLRSLWGQLDLVVSNPPYIPTALIDALDPVVRLHEPLLALDGGPDGLEPIRRIAAGAARALAPGGWLLLEHHHDQAERVRALLEAAGLVQVESRPDLEGHGRFAQARRPDPAP